MDRRSALKSVSILVGGALSSGAIAALVSGCKTDTSDGWVARFFTADQVKLFSEAAETIMPKTDTAGAKELMIERWVDSFLFDVRTEEYQKNVVKGLDAIEAASQKDNKKSFVDASPEKRTATLMALDKERANHKGEGAHPFHFVKEMVITAYFSTKVGVTEVLQYNPNPGKYIGCMPLAEAGNGKTWGETW
jgi:gluconate 2-dehydrogenase gamma chain